MTANVRSPLKTDAVYEKFRDELEKNHMGKIVAFDLDAEKIAGIGDDVLTAYNEAIKNSSQKQFGFKRVGSKYLHMIRAESSA